MSTVLLQSCTESQSQARLSTGEEFVIKLMAGGVSGASNEPKGFEKGLEPDKIHEVGTGNAGELVFVITWKNSAEVDIVPASEAYERCPQIVIAFCEKQILWTVAKRRHESEMGARGFERGLRPEKVLAERRCSRGGMFLMTWEGSDDIDLVPNDLAVKKCPEILVAFYQEQNIMLNSDSNNVRVLGDGKRGFEIGLEAESILEATIKTGKLMYLVKWKYSMGKDLVFATEANLRCPQVVIAFYQSRLQWISEQPAN